MQSSHVVLLRQTLLHDLVKFNPQELRHTFYF